MKGIRAGLYSAIAVGLVAGGWAYLRRSPAPVANAYVDSAVCVNCHKALADGFRKSGMGRSFARFRPENLWAAKSIYHQASDSYFSMIERGGETVQRRWQIGFDGKETNVDEKRVDYVMGSGNHSRTYFHRTSRNTLQQLPLHWYAEKGGTWAMSPGYDRPDHPGSTRLAGYECMFCHNAYPKIPEGHQAYGAEWAYVEPLPEGIDCQRCHGPGKRHVELAGMAGVGAEKIRAAIVNPKRLDRERAMEVCMQCHLHTTALKLPASMQRADRSPFSYVAGEPLGDFRLAFERIGGQLDRFENLSSAYRLLKSQCFVRSAGKLQCITCHNPHNIPRGAEAVSYYNGKCRDCHAAVSQPGHTASADCVGCHMPNRRTDDEVHVVMTDHLIGRIKPPGDLLATKQETREMPADQYHGEVRLSYPARLSQTPESSLELAAAQIRDGSNSAGLLQLAALIEKHRPENPRYYADLAEGYLATGDTAHAIQYYDEAVRRASASVFLLTKFGSALSEGKHWPKAEETLRRATALGLNDATAWGLLGWALWQQDKTDEAKAAIAQGIALDPEQPEMHNNLALILGATGDLAGAEKEMREAIRILPGVAEWRVNLGRLLGNRGALPEAAYQFQQAVRFKPRDAVAHLDYARVLAAMNRTAEAVEHLKIAARGDDAQARAGAQQILDRLAR